MLKVPLSLYVHIPWCVKKCPYCDFNSHEIRSTVSEDQYIDALIIDLQKQATTIDGREIISVFIGGGTPSLFTANSIKRLLHVIENLLPLTNNVEITIEANPGTVDHERFQLSQQSEFNVSEVAETGTTFVENAIIKARHAAQHTRLPALADDSGIEVDALQGAPGVYSARYAGEAADDEANNEKLLTQLADIPDAQRTARFQCVIVYIRHAQDPMPIICQGTWEGTILHKAKGANGFGYDPLFYVPTHDCSSAKFL